MVDIFLAYARKDERDCSRVRVLAEALEACGHDVFWDARIPGGVDFSSYIEQKLDEAKCAIVLWSQASVRSAWVRDEAGHARDKGRLIPALLDNVAQPLGFRQIQALDFREWAGETDSAAWRALTGALAQFGLKEPAEPRKRRVMIVDDEKLLRVDMETMVTDLGHEVVAIESSAEGAIRAANELRPDVILMDVQLGKAKSGIDAALEIAHLDIPVVYVTAAPEKVIGRVPGKPMFLTKPFAESTLAAVLKDVLGRSPR